MVRWLKTTGEVLQPGWGKNQDLKSSQWTYLQLTLTKDIYYNHQCKILLFNE